MCSAAGSRVCSVAPLLLFAYLAFSSYADSSCTLESQLSVSSPYGGGKLALIPSGCSLLGTGGQPLTVTTNTTLHGDPSTGGYGSLDLQFAKDAVLAYGTRLTFENLHLTNARLELTPFLTFSAFKSSTSRLTNVTIVTDCVTWWSLASSAPSTLSRGHGYLYVDNYSSGTVSATAVNVTCDLPAIVANSSGEFVSVGDSLQLRNALVASQLSASDGGSVGPLSILVTQSISISLAIWLRSNPVVISRNVTIQPDSSTRTLLDLQGAVSVVNVSPGAIITMHNFVFANISPLRGTLDVPSIIPCFSIPVWFFNYPRIPTAPQVTLVDITLVLTPSEYTYFSLWTLVLTTPTHMAESLTILRATTPVLNFSSSTNSTINYRQLMGTGLDMFNLTLTNVQPPGMPYNNVILDNPNLYSSFGVVPNLTWVPVFDLPDLMTILGIMQDDPPSTGVAVSILSNITIDPAIWPAGGYNISVPLLIVGQSNLGSLTWIDFRRTPRFVRAVGCNPDMYFYSQGMSLLNLPNGLTSGMSHAAMSAATRAGLNDVSLFLTNLGSNDTGCHRALLYANMTTFAITYTEFRLIHAQVVKALGTSTSGSGIAVASSFAFNLLNVVKDNITFQDVSGWGWQGSTVSLTYVFPDDVKPLYVNSFEGEPQDPLLAPPPPESSSGDPGLAAWQVALIVVGAVVVVALLVGLVAWRLVSRLKDEVAAVKSANTDKKSSSASGDQEHPNGGIGGLGSSAMAGGGSHAGNGAASSPTAIKGSHAAGGTSDDSTVPQCDRPPLEVLNSMMATLTQEIDDRHLTILEVIGQGGFGVVYRGLWKGLNVAVKTITFQDRVAGGEKAQHRAILEAAISSSLSHPNVVTTYSYDIKPLTVQGSSVETPEGHTGNGTNGQNGGMRIVDKRAVLDWKLYLVQEYCDGGSLRTAILKRKFYDTKKGEPRMEMIFDTCLELTGGLVHLHERNVVHGDLNPNNVLLKREASKKYGAVCKIADFGLSIKMSADQSHISNMRRGTPFYTCPQILARGNMTKAADMYSMGVMMWEMYHCCMSYRSLPTGFAARENFPNFPRKAPMEFAQMVTACLENEPVHRPTFANLRVDLEAMLSALKRGELRSGEDVLGPDPAGDAAHMAACQD